jgi:hypothetical protein
VWQLVAERELVAVLLNQFSHGFTVKVALKWYGEAREGTAH